MTSYNTLAAFYDALTEDVGYETRADFIEKLMKESRVPIRVMLDLACGTGTMTRIFTERGYELIAVDSSEDMLMEAREKAMDADGVMPIFLQQSMPELDLYGTVEAAICCLDSLNYLTDPGDVQKTFQRLRLFIQPGGVLVFDVNTPLKLRSMDGQVFLDETDDVYCVWRGEFEDEICTYYMDIFAKDQKGTYHRSTECHRERAYTMEQLTQWLTEAGFTDIRQYGDLTDTPPAEGEQRVYFSAIRGE